MRVWTIAVGLLAMVGVARASDNPWPSFRKPAEGPPRAIGDYSKGCLQGSVALPRDGEGYQVMRPSRRRYYGHPALIDFVQQLAEGLRKQGRGPLLIGDLAQARGGRSDGGHSSHQTGLDVDIWFWHPKVARRGPLTDRQRERIPARTVVDVRRGRIAPAWKTKVEAVLKLAAQDARVSRIFVNPIIKRELCEAPEAERGWLRRVRPWYGHDDHFHVRLKCPQGSPNCEPQDPLPPGDGCDALGFWFDKEAQAERRKKQRRYQKNVDEGRGWPDACEPLLERSQGG